MKLKGLVSALVSLMILLGLGGCRISISTTGASISPDSKTFQVKYFNNSARIVNATLASDFTDALRDRIETRTRLKLATQDADVTFEGEITGYEVTPVAVTGDAVAAMDRLTVTIQVTYTNKQTPEFNFNKSFSRYADYSRTTSLQSVEAELLEQINEQLLDDIYNAAFINW